MYIDPTIIYLSVSKIRRMTTKELKNLRQSLVVIQNHNNSLAVLLSYTQYLELQRMAGIKDPLE